MTHDARILQEGVFALEDMVVGAANADMANADARPAGLEFRPGNIDKCQLTWRGAGNGSHEIILPISDRKD